MLDALLRSLASGANAERFCARVPTLPLYVYGALRGEHAPAVPVAAAASLVELGIHLLDDLTDGDQRPDVPDASPGILLIAAAGLIGALPQLILAHVQAAPETRVRMQARLAAGLVRIGAGQQRDLRSVGSPSANLLDAHACAVDKSGERQATYAALGALLADASPDVVDGFAALGRALGTIQQIRSDCYDLFVAPESGDLARGVRSVPVALHLGSQRGQARDDLLVLLSAARADPAAQRAVRDRLRQHDVLAQCGLLIELECERARQALGRTPARQPWRDRLEQLIARHSLAG